MIDYIRNATIQPIKITNYEWMQHLIATIKHGHTKEEIARKMGYNMEEFNRKMVQTCTDEQTTKLPIENGLITKEQINDNQVK